MSFATARMGSAKIEFPQGEAVFCRRCNSSKMLNDGEFDGDRVFVKRVISKYTFEIEHICTCKYPDIDRGNLFVRMYYKILNWRIRYD